VNISKFKVKLVFKSRSNYVITSQNKLSTLGYSCNSQKILRDATRQHTVLPITRQLTLLCIYRRITGTSVRAAVDF